MEKYVLEYNTIRLHSAIGYVTPLAMLEGRQQSIFDERDRKLEEARGLRGRVAAGEKKAALAREFGISRETLYQYLRQSAASEIVTPTAAI